MTHFKTRCCLLAFALLACVSLPAYGEVVTFTTRSAFNAAAPGLAVETFESGLVAAGGVATCTSSVSSTAGGGCFPIGGLLPGVVYSASPGPLLALLGAGVAGNTSRVLGPNAFADTFNLTFSNANAIGFDVFPGPTAGNITISVFDTANALMGTFTVSSPLTGTFFGVFSTTSNIGRINIASLSTVPGELIDNLAFGNVGTNPAIPEPTTMLLLGTGLAGVAAKLRRRRKSDSD